MIELFIVAALFTTLLNTIAILYTARRLHALEIETGRHSHEYLSPIALNTMTNPDVTGTFYHSTAAFGTKQFGE